MPTADAVPVIDIRSLPDDAYTLCELDHACRMWGFFQVTGHGIPSALLAELHRQMQAFFALPMAAKRDIERTEANHWGYYDRELTKNVRDWKEIFDVGPPGINGALFQTRPQWPVGLPSFQPTLVAYMQACEQVARRLIGAIAVNLGAQPQALLDHFTDDHTSFLRLNHYPRCDDPAVDDSAMRPDAGQLGVNHHTDAGALTLLLQDEHPALQVWRGGHWSMVQPLAGALVVNIGDIVQVWSNDRYRAALHRVRASREVQRHSAPYFYNPDAACRYAPLAQACSPTDPPRYAPILWEAFRAARAAGDYADHGEEIQISHFRL